MFIIFPVSAFLWCLPEFNIRVNYGNISLSGEGDSTEHRSNLDTDVIIPIIVMIVLPFQHAQKVGCDKAERQRGSLSQKRIWAMRRYREQGGGTSARYSGIESHQLDGSQLIHIHQVVDG